MSKKICAVPDASLYNININKLHEDGQWLFHAKVKEWPDVEGWGDTYAEAYEAAIDAIGDLISLALELGRPFPEPAVDNNTAVESSGRFTARLPKGLHKRLKDNADAEGVSLNQYVVSILSFAAAVPQKYFSVGDSRSVREVMFVEPKSGGFPWSVLRYGNEEYSDAATLLELSLKWSKMASREVVVGSAAEVLVYENEDRLRELNVNTTGFKTTKIESLNR